MTRRDDGRVMSSYVLVTEQKALHKCEAEKKESHTIEKIVPDQFNSYSVELVNLLERLCITPKMIWK